ncbi:MAG: amidase [SAR202 cluster bacterium]|jgi:amidase|nr:amidase [SAR202 cluster bacterium]MDP6512993.1 amidase [SAR202 cluster bacterium]MDP6713277.1 amidase [SAR202 cluster bacterium]
MTTTNLNPFTSATAMLQMLRELRLSSVELLEMHLQRIQRLNPAINAIVIPDYENAREAAVKADEYRSKGDWSPLLGLPLTIKDCIDVQGLRGTAGVEAFAERVPDADAQITARARQAGAVIMGKTNVPPMAADLQANNPIFGRTNNPWNLERTSGGSTGGGAAALAAGLTPLEFGSDIGGSIRIPAAFCGVYGHKPSETAIPRSGHFPGNPLPSPGALMGVQGPLARTAQDLMLAFSVVSGPDVGEDAAWRLDSPAPRHESLADFRVAVLPRIPWLPVDSEILAAQENLVVELKNVGATVEEAQPELFADMRAHHELYSSLLTVLTSVGRPAEARQRLADGMRNSSDMFGDAGARGLEASASDLLVWLGQREKFRQSYRDFFRSWDVLLAPITIVPAFPHTDLPWPQRTVDVDGQAENYGLQTVYPAVATLCGQPATAFPAGLTRSGLPIGLQAIGPYLEDRTSIQFTSLLEREFGGFQSPPGYD